MKKIEVRDQVSLPLRRCFQLTVHGIRYRLFRSAVTVLIVSLAVAFLMMMLSTSYIDREVAADARKRTANRQLLVAWVDKLTVPTSPRTLREKLARLAPGTPGWAELRSWGGLGDEQLARLKDVAIREGRYLRYLSSLQQAQRAALVGARTDEEALSFLAEPGRLEEFLKKARNYPTPLPGGTAEKGRWLRRLVEDLKATEPLRAKIIAGHAAAVAGLAKELGAESVLERFCRAGPELPGLLGRYGFRLEPGELEVLRVEAQTALDAQRLGGLLRDPDIRSYLAEAAGVEVQAVAPKHVFKLTSSLSGARRLLKQIQTTRDNAVRRIRALKKGYRELNELLSLPVDQLVKACSERLKKPADAPFDELEAKLAGLIDHQTLRRALAVRMNLKALVLVKPLHVFRAGATPAGARWLREQMLIAREKRPGEIRDREQRLLAPLALSAERIAEVASAQRRQSRLNEVLAQVESEEQEGGWLGFGRRTAWLIIISFVVCVVGVANAMLMSVTERFREIATMKCLGALDSFIMIIFVLESSLQGFAGGIAGVALGVLLGVLRSVWGFGTLVFVNLPGLMLLASAGGCIVAGVVLAALAAVYPAWVAARLAPMEAMRIE